MWRASVYGLTEAAKLTALGFIGHLYRPSPPAGHGSPPAPNGESG